VLRCVLFLVVTGHYTPPTSLHRLLTYLLQSTFSCRLCRRHPFIPFRRAAAHPRAYLGTRHRTTTRLARALLLGLTLHKYAQRLRACRSARHSGPFYPTSRLTPAATSTPYHSLTYLPTACLPATAPTPLHAYPTPYPPAPSLPTATPPPYYFPYHPTKRRRGGTGGGRWLLPLLSVGYSPAFRTPHKLLAAAHTSIPTRFFIHLVAATRNSCWCITERLPVVVVLPVVWFGVLFVAAIRLLFAHAVTTW